MSTVNNFSVSFMMNSKFFQSISIKKCFSRSLVLVFVLASFSACQDNMDDIYARPSCNMTDEEKQTQRALDSEAIENHFKNNNIALADYKKTTSGLYYRTLSPGAGDLVKAGDRVDVHYIGKFLSGNTFDSSYERAKPISVMVDAKQVIAGWDEILQLMKVGEEVRVYIPSTLGYGKCPQGSIPPYSILMFDLKVVKKY
jgi:FKBP-type peptidyl-prolyl cis-trans isomerase